MEKFQVNIVLEILGRPPEHVKEALNALITRLGTEKGVRIIDKEIHEPIPAQNSKNLFTTFAEITLEIDSLYSYLGVLFAYMPSHIEIISPEKITLSNIDLNDLGNKLIQRLHDYDAITKKALYDIQILTKKLQEVAPHLFKQAPQQEENKGKKQKKPKTRKSKIKSGK